MDQQLTKIADVPGAVMQEVELSPLPGLGIGIEHRFKDADGIVIKQEQVLIYRQAFTIVLPKGAEIS